MSLQGTADPKPKDRRPERSAWTQSGQSVREHIHYVHELETLNEQQKEMSFLQHLMLYDETDERHALQETLNGAENNERCARRAVWLMAALAALAVVGLGYAALFLEDFPPNKSQFVTRIVCALGLASLVSLLAFVAYWLVARGKLDDQREGCRRLVTRILESRLGKPHAGGPAEMAAATSSRERVAANPPVSSGEKI